MYKVKFEEKEKEDKDAQPQVSEVVVMLPGDFGISDFTEYLNSINNTCKQFRFFSPNHNNNIWTGGDRLAAFGTEEGVVLVQYEEERQGEVKRVTSTFPDWIKRVKVCDGGVLSGGYDGAVRQGDKVLYEFGSTVQALETTAGGLVLAASESEIVCLYPDGTKKLKSTQHLSCLLLEEKEEGVLHVVSGHFDGKILEWRFSKKKGFQCVREKQLEGSINDILSSPNGLVIVTSERVYVDESVLYQKGFHCAAIFGTMLVTGSPNGTLSLFNLDTNTKRTSSKTDQQIKWISSVTFPSSELIASTGHDGIVRIWNTQLQLLQSIPICPGKKLLTSCHYNGLLYAAGEECVIKSIYI